ncbi:hypothetical protein DFH28DRAFT_958329 [Melampsora americana]|nr:hypothetical protein DFH28DRAFT_958329 [Melampsora americana]
MFESLTRFNQTDSASHPAIGGQKPTGSTAHPPNPSHLSKAVRKDPSVIPLGLIIGSVILVAGYFVTQKAPKEGGGVESIGPNRPPSSLSRPVKSSFHLSYQVPFKPSRVLNRFDHLNLNQPFTYFFLGKKSV